MDFVNTSFEYITLLQYRLKAAGTELEAFKSGRKYQDMENRHQKIVRALECRIKELERELAQTRRDMAAARENWFEVFEELEREFNRKLSAANKKARQMEKRALKAEAGRDEALDKVTGQRHKSCGRSLTVIMKIPPLRPPRPSGAKRSRTAGKRQAGSPGDSRGMKDTAGKSRFPQGSPYC